VKALRRRGRFFVTARLAGGTDRTIIRESFR
jgi:hypothetical protein